MLLRGILPIRRFNAKNKVVTARMNYLYIAYSKSLPSNLNINLDFQDLLHFRAPLDGERGGGGMYLISRGKSDAL